MASIAEENALASRARKACWAAKLARITLHECGHRSASLMIAASDDARELSTYMGHANISTTLDRYVHLTAGNEAEAADALNALPKRAETPAQIAQIATGGCRREQAGIGAIGP